MNNIYSNYNGLQMTWGRHAGRYTIQANYTYPEVVGNCAARQSCQRPSVTLDPFNLAHNYGVSRAIAVNCSTSRIQSTLATRCTHMAFLAGATSGWQISGITQLQSGANLTGLSNNTNFNMSLNNAILPGSEGLTNPDGSHGITISNQSIMGTNAVQLQPLATCNPTTGLSSHQYVNGACFAAPTGVGQNGPILLPVAYGPGYTFNSDLGTVQEFSDHGVEAVAI